MFKIDANKNYQISFSEVFNESWNLYVRMLGIGIVAVLLYSIGTYFVSTMLEGATGIAALSSELREDINGVQDFEYLIEKMQDFYEDNGILYFVIQVLAQFVLLLAFPLAGGFMLAAREMDQNGYTSVGTLFQGFQSKYWGRLMVLAIAYFILSKIALLFFIIPGVYVWVAAVLGCPIVMFTDKSGIDALKTSFQLVNKNWFTVFQILFVASLIGVLGYLLCCVGRIATYPMVLTTVYMLYKHIVGFETDELEQIGQS